MIAVVFGSGVILGSVITWYARAAAIDHALDTVGIKRKEHTQLRKKHEDLVARVQAIESLVHVV